MAGIGPASSDPAGFASVGGTPDLGAPGGGTEVFSASDSAHGRELWTSDGWRTSTALTADINPGSASSSPAGITVIGQTAYFTAFDPAHGRELWRLTVPPTPGLYLSGPLAPVAAGSSNTLTATLQPTPGGPVPSGRMTFYQDGTAIGSVPLTPQASGGSAASVTITARSGTHPIVAVYQGDATYTAATSGTLPVTGDQKGEPATITGDQKGEPATGTQAECRCRRGACSCPGNGGGDCAAVAGTRSQLAGNVGRD